MRLVEAAAGIIAFNLLWSVLQERVGSTNYCDEQGCERFKSVPVMNLCQAALSALVAWAMMQLRGSSTSSGKGVSFMSFLPPSLCHTIASPIGYSAMRYIPYPLYILVSSSKLIPVMVVGLLYAGRRPTRMDVLCAAVMTSGVLLYSMNKEGDSHGGHGSSASSSSSSSSGGGGGWSLDALDSNTLLGIGLTLLNLSMEGFTIASQDVLFARATAEGQAVSSLQMQWAMNAWSVILLGCGMWVDAALRGGDSVLLAFTAFASRHPELLWHILGFSLCGAVAQLFFFACMSGYGSFATTTITISRKFVSVLLSVAIYRHILTPPQWLGVTLVFTGLGLQLTLGRSSHGHGHAHGPGEAAAERKAAAAVAAGQATALSARAKQE